MLIPCFRFSIRRRQNQNHHQEQLQQLEQFLIDVPFKYASPVLQFLGKLVQEQNPQTEEVKEEA